MKLASLDSHPSEHANALAGAIRAVNFAFYTLPGGAIIVNVTGPGEPKPLGATLRGLGSQPQFELALIHVQAVEQ